MVANFKTILYALVFSSAQSYSETVYERTPVNLNSSGSNGYEILLTKMDFLEKRLAEQQQEIKKLNDQNKNNMKSMEVPLEQHLKNVEDSIVKRIELLMGNQLKKTVQEIVIPQLNQLSNGLEKSHQLEQVNVSSMITSVNKTINNNYSIMLNDLESIKSKVKTLPVVSCSDEPTKKSGVYLLQPFIGEKPFAAYCEQEKFKGGWLVIQHRFDGSVDFLRNWTAYTAGFGQPSGEFWLGLETLHRLTNAKQHSLVVEVESFDGKNMYAMYDDFAIGNETEQYKLERLGKPSGKLGDSFEHQKGGKFSTLDKDIDGCVARRKGPGWFNECTNTNLNGIYGNKTTDQSNYWWKFRYNHEGLKMTRMMIKEA